MNCFKTPWHLLLLTWVSAMGCAEHASTSSEEKNRRNQFVDSLLSTLSLEDKAGEMTQLTLGMLEVGDDPYEPVEPQRLDSAHLWEAIVEHRVGSILNCGGRAHTVEEWHRFIGEIQGLAKEVKPSGIPVLYGIDAIHGANYTQGSILSPQQIGLAATWNEELVKKVAENVAKEVRNSGIPWNFSPVMDLGRDPRWPRFWETFGEDPHLAGRMGQAMVKGYQDGPAQMAATLKHFMGYGLAASGKDRQPAYVPERQLREIVMPSFQAAIDAGAMSVMVNSGEMNGIPVHSNPWILQDLLREEMGFDGVVVTDWEDIGYLHSRHMISGSYKESVRMAIEAGIDLAMVPTDYEFTELLIELVKEGTIPESRLDQSVRRLLAMKYDLGLFEPGGAMPPLPDKSFEREGMAGPAALAALQSITLLKNEGTSALYIDRPLLPLSGMGKILVTGPTANSLNALNGGWTWTWQGTDSSLNTPDAPTALQAMEVEFGRDRIVASELEMNFGAEDIARVVRKIKGNRPDVAVVFLGEMPYTEFVGNIDDLDLADNQQDLVEAIHGTGTPVVAVFIEGRPRTFNDIEPMLDAAVMAYLPGDFGGQAIARVLSGAFNPSGHLPFTWPRHPSTHTTYDHKHTERPDVSFGNSGFNPMYAFGHGLSYGDVVVQTLTTDQETYRMRDTIRVQVTIENQGDRSVADVIHLFSQDKVASVTPPADRLEDYQRVVVGAGESLELAFDVAVSDLGFINRENQYAVEAGNFAFRVSDHHVDFEVLERK
ncbi:MAG: beta-glucosidase [Flavobacteriales bacterium]